MVASVKAISRSLIPVIVLLFTRHDSTPLAPSLSMRSIPFAASVEQGLNTRLAGGSNLNSSFKWMVRQIL